MTERKRLLGRSAMVSKEGARDLRVNFQGGLQRKPAAPKQLDKIHHPGVSAHVAAFGIS